jgi:hypothetical protein
LQIWLTNIIVFGLAYWELDRGSPVQRAKLSRPELLPADFRFSQDEDDDAIDEVAASSSARVDWAPVFVDYLYVSVTSSTAFSPTDTMPLSSRAKLLMSIQAISALIVSLLVIAKHVGGLKPAAVLLETSAVDQHPEGAGVHEPGIGQVHHYVDVSGDGVGQRRRHSTFGRQIMFARRPHDSAEPVPAHPHTPACLPVPFPVGASAGAICHDPSSQSSKTLPGSGAIPPTVG